MHVLFSVMGHRGSKRSFEVQDEGIEEDQDIDRFEAYPKWEDKVETLKLLKNFLQFMDYKGNFLTTAYFLPNFS